MKRNCISAVENGKLKLEIFLDKSSVEFFANHGLKALIITVYPKETATDIRFKAKGNLVIEVLYFTELE
ncbi:GH32 C-terminal domain-containing protein [Carnobacterium gallinarum]|uniref:GH32 C-terminal domain-containing protein n=1 Tax=Carnobacterium gallinarum TaxID=2749 RepID=UPI00054DB30B|nr:GH32 C-terminal domain-containing protein [Carnobacterium gallinarum]